jgi:polyisoprenoid-binding protein YceI
MQRLTLSVLIVLSVAAPTSAEQVDLTFDPARTTIDFTLDATMHKVHGTFQLVRGTVRYDPETGEASGRIVVDARSGDTGNAKRDRDMHGKVLKSEAHPEIVLVPERVVGDLPSEGSNDMTVVGGFRIGGARHTIEIPIAVVVHGNDAEIKARFEVPFVEWGLEDPSKFLLRVAKEVAVTVTTHATVTPATDEEAD